MRLNGQRLLLALAVSGISAGLVLALPPPYDFSGHWSGTATSRSGELSLTADFAATSNPRKFTGDSVLMDALGNHVDCTFTARFTKKLKLHLRCDDGRGPRTQTVHFDTTTQALTGAFVVGRRHPEVARFTLTRAPA